MRGGRNTKQEKGGRERGGGEVEASMGFLYCEILSASTV